MAPSNISATVMSSTSITVEWEGIIPCTLANGLIVKYRIQYRAQDGEIEITEQSGAWNSSSDLLISGLVPSTTYFFQVAAVNEEGDVGLYSDPIAAETRPLCSDYSSQCIATVVPVGIGLVVVAIATFLIVFCCYRYIPLCTCFKLTFLLYILGIRTV